MLRAVFLYVRPRRRRALLVWFSVQHGSRAWLARARAFEMTLKRHGAYATRGDFGPAARERDWFPQDLVMLAGRCEAAHVAVKQCVSARGHVMSHGRLTQRGGPYGTRCRHRPAVVLPPPVSRHYGTDSTAPRAPRCERRAASRKGLVLLQRHAAAVARTARQRRRCAQQAR